MQKIKAAVFGIKDNEILLPTAFPGIANSCLRLFGLGGEHQPSHAGSFQQSMRDLLPAATAFPGAGSARYEGSLDHVQEVQGVGFGERNYRVIKNIVGFRHFMISLGLRRAKPSGPCAGLVFTVVLAALPELEKGTVGERWRP
jgi:hypothetical protein